MQDIELLNVSVPRYTSYPTAPEWHPIEPILYGEHLKRLGETNAPVSLYVHIPFCHSMCLFCGCSVVLNRRPENEERYLQYLLREIDLVAAHLGNRKEVVQLHFGGGTPTKLSEKQLERLFTKLVTSFSMRRDAEIAIEVDPRTIWQDQGQKLKFLKTLGFTRVSFGVQDVNEKVQEAIKRRQSREMTQAACALAKELGFEGVNVDLIYGLPFQTQESFSETIQAVIALSPDRIALFSYAKIHWLKPHQKAIKEETLPTTEEKFAMYFQARQALILAGYVAIGMDHFAKANDSLAMGYKTKALRRNFQGYTVWPAEDLIGFGVTAIGHVQNGYFQNVKELDRYYELLDGRSLTAFRGKVLSEDDLVRRWVIERLMCDFRVEKTEQFDSYFSEELKRLEPLVTRGFIENRRDALQVTALGELFIRNISSCFDWYFHKKETANKFSRAV